MKKNNGRKEQKLNINANPSGILEIKEYFNELKAEKTNNLKHEQ